LNKRLTKTKSYTKNGWLIWDGIRRVTEGRAMATYYDKVDAYAPRGLPDGAVLSAQWSVPLGHDCQT